MNLVVDDAVEVKLATKTDEEKRRPLGMWKLQNLSFATSKADKLLRIQVKYCSRATMSPSSKLSSDRESRLVSYLIRR